MVKIRNAGSRLGFEKIVVKNGLFIAFFIDNQMSPYYSSFTFKRVIDRVNEKVWPFEFKQSNGKLKLMSRGVESLQKARLILSKLE